MNWKISVIFFLFFTLTLTTSAAGTITLPGKTALLGKVWGVLKYYHPNVAKSSDEWDDAIIDYYGRLKNCRNSAEVNLLIEDVIKRAGGVNVLDQRIESADLSVSDKKGLFSWIDSSTILSAYNKLKLKILIVDSLGFTSRYVKKSVDGRADFSVEKDYAEKGYFPSEEYRVLGVIRYWNLINYFYPDKSMITADWHAVFEDCLDAVIRAPGQDEYHMALRTFTALIKDAQSVFVSDVYNAITGINTPGLKLKAVEGKIIVTALLPEKLQGAPEIIKGDEIVTVDGVAVDELKVKLAKEVSYSNQKNMDRNICDVLLNGFSDTVTVGIDRGETGVHVYTLNRYPLEEIKKAFEKLEDNRNWKPLVPGIAYINMKTLLSDDVDDVAAEISDYENLVFDCRGGANSFIALKLVKLLNKNSTPYLKYTEIDPDSPGTFIFQEPLTAGPLSENSNYFKGKIYLLVDRNVQSDTEIAAMALQAMDGAVVVGEATAGSAGTPSMLSLPGKIKVGFSTRGIFYPDGIGIRQGGIKIDEVVDITIEGVKEEADEILARAISSINKAAQGN